MSNSFSTNCLRVMATILRSITLSKSRTTLFPDGQKRVFIKGAVAKLMHLFEDAPKDLLSVSDDWSAGSYYVLACGVKPFHGDLCATRDELEQGLVASALLIFKNELKPDSKAALAELHSGGLTTMVIHRLRPAADLYFRIFVFLIYGM